MTDKPAQTGREFMRSAADSPDKWADAMMQSAEREGFAVDREWLKRFRDEAARPDGYIAEPRGISREWLLRWLSDAIDAGRRSKLRPVNPEETSDAENPG
jgi:hypothetical protein